MRTHAKYPPSALRSWEICPGHEGSKVAGPAAVEGTKLHKAVEKERLTGLDAEQKSLVQYALGKVEDVKKTLSEKPLILKEFKLNIVGLTSGTADMLLATDDTVHLIDYKFGRNKVDPVADNLQLQAYALGAFHKFPTSKKVIAHVVIPRLDIHEAHVFFREHTPQMELRVAAAIARRQTYENTKDPSMLRPVQANCLYCSVKSKCPKLHEIVLRVAPAYEKDLLLPAKLNPEELSSSEQLGLGMALAEIMLDWGKQMKDRAKECALNGTEVAGYDLQERRGAKKIKDPLAVWLVVKHLMTNQEFVSCCEVSASQLEATIGAKAVKGKKGVAVQEFKDKLATLGLVETAEPVYFLQKTKS